MEVDPLHHVFVPNYTKVSVHSATEHACWRGESNSSERLVGLGAPGAVPGAALCRPCQLRGRAGGRGGEGAVQAQRCQQAATAQPRPSGQGAEQRGPARGGWAAPACPHLPSPPQADPQHPSAWRQGAACRDTLLSPGSLEPAASCVPSDIMCINSEHSQSVCPSNTRLSPPRANLWEKQDEA